MLMLRALVCVSAASWLIGCGSTARGKEYDIDTEIVDDEELSIADRRDNDDGDDGNSNDSFGSVGSLDIE